MRFDTNLVLAVMTSYETVPEVNVHLTRRSGNLGFASRGSGCGTDVTNDSWLDGENICAYNYINAWA